MLNVKQNIPTNCNGYIPKRVLHNRSSYLPNDISSSCFSQNREWTYLPWLRVIITITIITWHNYFRILSLHREITDPHRSCFDVEWWAGLNILLHIDNQHFTIISLLLSKVPVSLTVCSNLTVWRLVSTLNAIVTAMKIGLPVKYDSYTTAVILFVQWHLNDFRTLTMIN